MKPPLILLIFIILFWNLKIIAQVAINNDGNSPDPSAVLDLQSTDKGFLLPRIDYNDRPRPAAPGLMIYVTANGPLGDSCLYMFDGENWTKVLNQVVSFIGTEMEGGIVFYHSENQGFGLVSAEADLGFASYGCFGTLIGPNGQHTGIGFGDVNTGAILAICTVPGIAADLCDELNLNGYSDWFLPSRDELLEMYVHKNEIGGFSNTLYWSSAECAIATPVQNSAWVVNFNNGSLSWTSKSGSLRVRCVRKYTFGQ